MLGKESECTFRTKPPGPLKLGFYKRYTLSGKGGLTYFKNFYHFVNVCQRNTCLHLPLKLNLFIMSIENENNSGKFKILIGVLSVLLIALAVYTVTLFNDSKNTVSNLETQKADIEQELEGLIANYDEVIKDNELKDKDLLAARERISVLLDSVKDAEANVALIERYKAEVGRLKQERAMLFKRADSLIAANRQLAIERDSASTDLANTRLLIDSVSTENLAM